MSTKHKKT